MGQAMRYIGSAFCFLVGAVILLLVCYPQVMAWISLLMMGPPKKYHYYYVHVVPGPPAHRLIGAVLGTALLALGFFLMLRDSRKVPST